jgi:hypothetical protein
MRTSKIDVYASANGKDKDGGKKSAAGVTVTTSGAGNGTSADRDASPHGSLSASVRHFILFLSSVMCFAFFVLLWY